MTATDELHRLLDELGVEYKDRNVFGKHVFHWGKPFHGAMFTDGGEWTELVVENATPEQAIEATLGSDLQAENEKLRELVRHMHTCLEHYEPGDTISCEQCPYDNETWGCDYERIMAELGIEVDA